MSELAPRQALINVIGALIRADDPSTSHAKRHLANTVSALVEEGHSDADILDAVFKVEDALHAALAATTKTRIDWVGAMGFDRTETAMREMWDRRKER